MKMKFFLPILTLFSLFLLYSCNKDVQDGNQAKMNIRLTDAPIDLDSVFVDIREVRVKIGNDIADSLTDSGWQTLTTNAGIYNLLRLQNGVDTLLATGLAPATYVKEIRLILGPNNRVVDTFGVSKPLTIPSGSESGLKIKINKKLNATLNTFLIDFDTDLSIKKESDGYKLRPVIKLK